MPATHASAQLIGGRTHQCDATATYTHRSHRAYVLLDGIGSSDDIAGWTRTTARRIAREAARAASAEKGLRAVHSQAAAEPGRSAWYADDMPSAVAVVAVHAPGQPLDVAWCGDSRAYLLTGGRLQKLTSDHNERQRLLDMGEAPRLYARNIVNSYVGDARPDPLIGTAAGPTGGRLLLASDGAYEPLEDSCRDMAAYLTGSPRKAADALVEAAIDHGSHRPDNATCLVADLA